MISQFLYRLRYRQMIEGQQLMQDGRILYERTIMFFVIKVHFKAIHLDFQRNTNR